MKCPRCQNDNPEGTRFCGHCGRALADPNETAAAATATFQTPTKGLERGTTFARRFEIIEEIGQGGMGTVYKAYDSKIREVVALKLLKPEIASDLEVIERFRNEIKLARQVAHRHVCRMYDIGEEWLTIYISMEYVPGEDLKSFIRRSGHLTEAKAVWLARQIAEGLAEAHRLGVVHRDLKPQNVMIDKDGNAKIMDFGIARSLHTKGATGTGVIIGTPEYMAPEQAEGREVDQRVDIYALGAILFEMVTGRAPFEGATPLSIVLKHRSEPPADPSTINAQISAGLSRIILKCLAKSRDDRYPSAAGVLEDLTAVEQGLPVTGPVTRRASPATARTRPLTGREITVKLNLKKILIEALVVIALVVLGIVIATNKRGQAGPSGRRGLIVSSRESGQGLAVPEAPAGGPLPGFSSQSAGAAIMGYLAPFLKDPQKLMSEKDALEFEKALGTIKEKYPEEAAALSRWIDSIRDRIAEGRKQKAEGNLAASKRSYDRGESEMRKLLAQVSERERAETAFRELQEAKRRAAGPASSGRMNLLTWIALEKEKDASDAFSKNDFSGARILCGILAQVHALSPRIEGEDEGLTALRDLAVGKRQDAEAARAPAKQAWLYERAVSQEESAGQMVRDGLVPQAAEQYILAAFLYEKAKEVAVESAQAGPRG
ncbi:MAG TPA: serine/threonine-protein kinase [Candidatus Aminicenantes bacterium]|nr:serine/threonine-protein kinase [Candidatus Aminicenantes bacterium]HRY65007.1 serine/threonine-protein kinase [Candidatus Aminicenantes bacterium]HRZ71920.1 serine/threonine-protein kinase [Candidatus Aminicenantes bacterium]